MALLRFANLLKLSAASLSAVATAFGVHGQLPKAPVYALDLLGQPTVTVLGGFIALFLASIIQHGIVWGIGGFARERIHALLPGLIGVVCVAVSSILAASSYSLMWNRTVLDHKVRMTAVSPVLEQIEAIKRERTGIALEFARLQLRTAQLARDEAQSGGTCQGITGDGCGEICKWRKRVDQRLADLAGPMEAHRQAWDEIALRLQQSTPDSIAADYLAAKSLDSDQVIKTITAALISTEDEVSVGFEKIGSPGRLLCRTPGYDATLMDLVKRFEERQSLPLTMPVVRQASFSDAGRATVDALRAWLFEGTALPENITSQLAFALLIDGILVGLLLHEASRARRLGLVDPDQDFFDAAMPIAVADRDRLSQILETFDLWTLQPPTLGCFLAVPVDGTRSSCRSDCAEALSWVGVDPYASNTSEVDLSAHAPGWVASREGHHAGAKRFRLHRLTPRKLHRIAVLRRNLAKTRSPATTG